MLGVEALAVFAICNFASLFEEGRDVFVGVFRPVRFLPDERVGQNKSRVIAAHLVFLFLFFPPRNLARFGVSHWSFCLSPSRSIFA
jgi:hypothetical protein